MLTQPAEFPILLGLSNAATEVDGRAEGVRNVAHPVVRSPHAADQAANEAIVLANLAGIPVEVHI